MVKSPPATSRPVGRIVRARTAALVPKSRGDHAAPSHRAMKLAATPPIVRNSPPAIKSPLERVASARTGLSLDPAPAEPRGCHCEPFHEAMLTAGWPPAVWKYPLTVRLPPGSWARPLTNPLTPEPSADQEVPSHRATELA